jgi:hypothetical protein
MKNFLSIIQTNVVSPKLQEEIDTTELSIWFCIALIELLIIVYLIFKSKKKKSELAFGDLSKKKIRNSKKSEIDMSNVMNSINGSKTLYKELSRSCHPDRFVNSDKQLIAEEIFQDITKHKRDFKKLTELKERAIIELNINFK